MIRTVQTIDTCALTAFDAVIDVRSPGEFAEDHLPGAINLPVLSDAERTEVGVIYKRDKFAARLRGAAYVSRNIAGHLDGALAGHDGSFAPLVHCWRGGQRSHAMATVLDQIGWRVSLLEGGYRTWRRQVTARLYDEDWALKLVLLDGGTGTAKTEILGRLADLGVQTLDLEGLAGHRGSLLGGLGRPQPGQKLFESRLLAAIDDLDPALPVVVEAESSRIGARMTPPGLWRAMTASPRIVLDAPQAARARYLVETYADIIADRERLESALARLPTHPGRKRLAAWRDLIEAGDFEALAVALMELHYDPAYARSSRSDERTILGRIELSDLGPAEQARATEAITDLLPR